MNLDDNDGTRDVFFLHALAIGLDGFDADLGFIRKEHKHLICRVVIVRHQHNEVTPRWPPFTRHSFLLIRNCLHIKEKYNNNN